MKIDTDKKKIKEILERGIERAIDKKSLLEKLSSGKILRVKHGVDPTGPNIHIGRAMQLWKLRAFQELGHKVVLIIGDFTAQIGDASDKQAIRKPLSLEEIKENMKDYENQIGRIVDMKEAEVHYNSSWLEKLNAKDIISLSMNFTAQQMIVRRNFKERWEKNKPIGLHELYYPILQGYDSVAVRADIEIGGYDQLFNLMAGRRIQEIFKQKPQDIMVSKMLNGLDGRKMSTSWGNIITIIDSPKQMYGKLMSMRDELIYDYFENCFVVPLEELKDIKKEISQNPRKMKALLAKKTVALYHGEKEALKEEKEFEKIFVEKKAPSDILEVKIKEKELLIIDLIFKAGLASSKNEAKRLVLQGAIKINEKKETDWKKKIAVLKGMVIQSGRRKFIKIA
ncbi:MAG: tyrosine--tRNA ligase [Candidatus Pacebacteria bacterium]|nr:tyrosine--tRNA ligase [Candidatus Paceibacterota bacterium]